MQFLPRIKSIDKWPGDENPNPKNSPFRANYGDTKSLLIYELSKLKTIESSIQLGMFVDRDDIKVIGTALKANARVHKPGVVLTFTREVSRKYNPATYNDQVKTIDLSYPCDAFNSWQQNLRAIALSLEALRRVSRYGVFSYETMAERLALPPADGKATSEDDAIQFIATYSDFDEVDLRNNPSNLKDAYRQAAAALHPDRNGGDGILFTRLIDAKNFLKI
jgi:hypothetical protein